ncbi:phosphoethanolamine transferase [uncultured Neptuniibacter sp.]|uniref:phosphoethanolamine transferase n=1 Tax=uncultured Neptuniibacter sp. TaxID=502143 RepID=UPI00262C4049|nr:phosphoethanolamine transferase [uncultured Neptuniibacter sp.]
MSKAFTQLVDRGRAAPKRFFLLIFICLAISDLLLVRDLSWLLENLEGKRFWVNYGLSLGTLFLLLLVFAPIKNGPARSLFLFFILGTQVAQQSYFAIYGNFVSVFDLRFVAADPMLTLQLWLDNAIILKPLILLALEIPLLLLLFRLELKPNLWLKAGSTIVASLLFLLVTFSWYGISKFQFSSVAYAGVFPSLIERQTFKGKLANKPVVPEQADNLASKPDIVFVIGESLTLSQLGVYGYERQTTPHLQAMIDQKEMLLFRNAVSIGTRTLSSVPYMLTGLQGIDPYGLVYSSPTLFNYAKAAGYQTALITAQDFQWRNVDQIFVDQDLDHYQSGTDFSASVSVSEGADDMKVLEEGIFPYLTRTLSKERKAPMLLVAQMNGSHYPYNTHSPASVKQFLPETNPNGVNAYDNTVLYTDLYLSRLVERVREYSPNAWIIYSSDHGQDISRNKTQFNRSYSSGVIHNPLMVFPPAQAYTQLKQNIDAPVSQADIFATFLDIMQLDPVSEINGLSLQNKIDPERNRVVSAYMKTLHNEPNAVLVLPDLTYIHVDFDRQSATLADGKTIVPYDSLEPALRQTFDRRLTHATETQ